jgi:hypothetical protein
MILAMLAALDLCEGFRERVSFRLGKGLLLPFQAKAFFAKVNPARSMMSPTLVTWIGLPKLLTMLLTGDRAAFSMFTVSVPVL